MQTRSRAGGSPSPSPSPASGGWCGTSARSRCPGTTRLATAAPGDHSVPGGQCTSDPSPGPDRNRRVAALPVQVAVLAVAAKDVQIAGRDDAVILPGADQCAEV